MLPPPRQWGSGRCTGPAGGQRLRPLPSAGSGRRGCQSCRGRLRSWPRQCCFAHIKLFDGGVYAMRKAITTVVVCQKSDVYTHRFELIYNLYGRGETWVSRVSPRGGNRSLKVDNCDICVAKHWCYVLCGVAIVVATIVRTRCYNLG